MTDSAGCDLKLSGAGLSDLLQSVLAKGASFRFRASGFSMTPFIRDKDILTVSGQVKRKPVTGDVVAVINPLTGSVIVHRIVRQTVKGVLIKGDNCRRPDGVFTRKSIVGIITAVERNGKRVGGGIGSGKGVIAFISGTGFLNVLLLPALRRIKRILA